MCAQLQTAPVVTAIGVHKAYGPSVVLASAVLTISEGERVGVVGVNGAGKSTLSRIIAGVELPDGGSVSRRRGASVLYLEQVPRFDGDPTAEEVALSGLDAWKGAISRHEAANRAVEAGEGDMQALIEEQAESAEEVERLGGWDQRHRALAMLDKLGIQRPEQRVSTLSGGERRRVALARILIARPDLAILDEPTNHLDADTVDWLEQYLLGEHAGAVMLVTHDRYLLDRVASRTLEVASGEVYAYDGGYERYLEQKAERLAHQARTEQNRQNFLRRELAWLRRQPKARTGKQKARIDRAEAAMSVRAPVEEASPSFELSRARTGKTILEVRDLAVDVAGRRLITDLTLFVTEGERIGIVGRSGSGKTTLLRALLGSHPPAAGSVTMGHNTRVAYFDQERGGLKDDATVFDNVVTGEGSALETHSYLERFGFDRAQQRQAVGSLSGGERARVALARMLEKSANLLVLDEPTNDLDVATLSALESLLVEQGVTALIVTHDRWFLDRVATAILAFEPAGAVTRYAGNYADYRRTLAARQVRSDAAERRASEPPKAAPRPSAAKKKLTFAEERELAGLEDRIEEAESRVRDQSEKLANPDTYAAGGRDVPLIQAGLEAARTELEQLMARWEVLESKKQP